MSAIFIRFLKGDGKFFTIVFFILILVLAIGIITPTITSHKENKWNEELDSKVLGIETTVIKLFRDKEKKLLLTGEILKESLSETLSQPNTSYRGLIRLVNEEKYSEYSIEVLAPNGRIIAWNESIAVREENIFPLAFPLGEIYFHNTELVTYLTVTDTVVIEHDAFYLILSLPFEKHYNIQNTYFKDISFSNDLTNRFYTQFNIGFNSFSEKSKDGRKHSFELLNNKNKKIGVVSFVKPSLTSFINSINTLSADFQAVLVIGACFIIAFGFRKDFRNIKYRTVRFIILLIYIVLLRLLLYVLNMPARFMDGVLTDPAYFSSAFSGGIVKSPVELFITSFFFLVIAVYLFKNILHYLKDETVKKTDIKLLQLIIIFFLAVVFFLSVRAVAATIKSVIFDSAIRYFKEPDLIPNLPSFFMNLNVLIFGAGCILLLSCLIMLIIFFFSKLNKKDNVKSFFTAFLVFEILGVVFLFVQREPLVTPFIMFFIVGFIFVLSYHFYKREAGSYNYIYATLAASLITIMLLNHFNLELERDSLKTVAYEINRPNDNLLHFHIEETLNSAASNQTIVNYFLRRNTNYDAVAFLIWCNSSLQRESLHSSVSLYNRNKELTGSFSMGIDHPVLSRYNFNGLALGKSKIFVPEKASENYDQIFTGIIPVSVKGIPIGYISATVVFDLQLIGNRGIPDFLESGENVLSPAVDVRQLKIFEFADSRVSRVYGDIYPSRDQVEPIWDAQFSQDNEAWLTLTLNDEEYLTYLVRTLNGDSQKIIAVLLREKQFTWNLFNFFKIFVIHSFFILILFTLISLSRIKKIKYTFKAQVLIAFLFISIIPVVVLAIYNRQVVKERSRTAIINELSERASYLENHIRVQNMEHPERDLKALFQSAGKELGISFGTYEVTNQTFNLSEQYYNTGLFPYKLNPQAYYHLNYLSYREYLTHEKVEDFEYDSFYKKISVDDKSFIISVNNAFNKVDVIFSTMDMDIFLFGIYSLAVLIIIIISTILANNISAPIRRLTKATVSIAQGDMNVEIANKEKGEIRDLVESFNSMTRELQKNQIELAELERENAWKEMAKQVAHEIKNPLTPLKLSVQQLIATFRDKSDKFDSVFEKVTQTILAQIENLSSIATEFSRFAKMPSLKLEIADLIPVLKDTLNLFVDEKINIKLNSEVHFAETETDINQFRRMTINLIRNSIQAESTGINIHVKLIDNDFVFLFSDNGKGISAENKDKIFEPSFTTKEKGMGIGLKLIKRFLEGINGNIILLETSDKGTTFKITIPKFSK